MTRREGCLGWSKTRSLRQFSGLAALWLAIRAGNEHTVVARLSELSRAFTGRALRSLACTEVSIEDP
jgi:cell division inhibitor SulA